MPSIPPALERKCPCYPPIRATYYFPYRTREFIKHHKGDENASNEPPQTVGLLLCLAGRALKQHSCTCVLYFGPILILRWYRHYYSFETQRAHRTPRNEITTYISMHRRHFSAPGARDQEIVLFSSEYRIFFCANQCQMQSSKIDTQMYVLLCSTSNDALNRKEKHTYSNNGCGSGNLIPRLLIIRFLLIYLNLVCI